MGWFSDKYNSLKNWVSQKETSAANAGSGVLHFIAHPIDTTTAAIDGEITKAETGVKTAVNNEVTKVETGIEKKAEDALNNVTGGLSGALANALSSDGSNSNDGASADSGGSGGLMNDLGMGLGLGLGGIVNFFKAFFKIFEALGDLLTGNFAAAGEDIADVFSSSNSGNSSSSQPSALQKIGNWFSNTFTWDNISHAPGDAVRSVAKAVGWKAPEATADVIIDAAKKYGVDPTLALTVTGVESHWDPNAENNAQNSHAMGLFQFEPGTWKGMGMSGLNPLSAEANADAGARLLAQNRDALKNYLGRNPTNAEIYVADMFGPSGAEHLISGGANVTAAQALVSAGTKQSVVYDAIGNNLGAKYEKAHPDWKNMSASDLLAVSENIYASKQAPIATANADLLGAAPPASTPQVASNSPSPAAKVATAAQTHRSNAPLNATLKTGGNSLPQAAIASAPTPGNGSGSKKPDPNKNPNLDTTPAMG